jgi:hypothetical protein
MSTKTLIDRLEPWCSGWNRSTGKKNLLHVIQVALDKLYALGDGDRFVYRGTDNKGFPPYLKTVAGTYRYNVEAANLSCGNIVKSIGGVNYNLVARTVKKVFIDAQQSSSDYVKYVTSAYPYIDNPYGMQTNRVFVSDVVVSSQPGYADANQPPIVDFPFDPGTNDTKFFIEFTYGPPRLLSESIPIPVPIDYIEEIEKFVIGYIQGRESGRLSNDMTEYFESIVCPRFINMMNAGAVVANNETQIRLC